jgi:hypothetical protein
MSQGAHNPENMSINSSILQLGSTLDIASEVITVA